MLNPPKYWCLLNFKNSYKPSNFIKTKHKNKAKTKKAKQKKSIQHQWLHNRFVNVLILPTRNNLSRWGKELILRVPRPVWNPLTLALPIVKQCLTRHALYLKNSTVILLTATKLLVTTLPPNILPVQQGPDLVLIIESSKSIIIIAITIPFEKNIYKVNEHKLNNYADLAVICRTVL